MKIPRGCTSKVQPLDVSHNKLKSPQKEDIANWISFAPDQLQGKPTMGKSFNVCGILEGEVGQVQPEELLDGQLYPESEDDMEDPLWRNRSS